MVNFLVKHFIPSHEQVNDASVRTKYGVLVGVTGIILNLFLFAAKLAAGILTGSISVWADALNNLSDAGSSIVTLIGFRMAGQPADAEHPFGHGRIEYISGLIVSIIIVVMGVELAKSSIDKILNPEAVAVSAVSIIILLGSILVKLWMCYFNRKIAKTINSIAMKASSVDSLTDAVATSAVILGIVISYFSGLLLDGWIGILVSAFIVYNGFRTAADSLSPLLGKAPDPEFVRQIEQTVLSYNEISGIHDLIIHDYGPGRYLVSLHAEVSGKQDILVIHDAIDCIEQELYEKFNCDVTIHMDPVAVNDPEILAIKNQVTAIVKGIDEKLSIHDFRMVKGPTHSNLIFDLVIPYKYKLSDVQIMHLIRTEVRKLDKGYYTIIKIDHAYL